ncbi:MprA protease, GlyGly-CTERM protein-sorting domain-containing form [Thioalkalivibrio thiocyanodenitrificans]|uniref:MprA protease, GlyGly-CTERM protein-sorting domain-containing form n=1 Tax=Thioalkalivibrio thiocyanodenitrificans TaxID=243063 RepID=UPI000365FC9D|nr:MprA protease, GlyGly-CTERM protein-sorting domain-containing form [Thioalkalivibrio thiocyanodenitrificans]
MNARTMRRCCTWLVAVACVLPLSVLATPTDRIIVRVSEAMRPAVLAGGAPAPRADERVAVASAATGRDVTWLRAMSGGADVLRLPEALPEDEVMAAAQALMALPGVEYAVPDRRVFPMRQPNDPGFSDQWHLQPPPPAGDDFGINAPAAWDVTTGDAVTVAVVDTGIRFTHEDLRGRILPGHDFVSEDVRVVDGQVQRFFFTANDGDARDPVAADPGDWVTGSEGVAWGCSSGSSSWHGTYMAGIAAAATDNGVGQAGVSWGAMILPVRALGKCGGYTSDVVDGIRWAAGLPVPDAPVNPYPARVINLSLGGRGICDSFWQSAINDATNAGTLVVTAAGNASPLGESLDLVSWTPATCGNTLTVAATDRDGNRAAFSNYGTAVDISAPGIDIRSTGNAGITYPLEDGYGRVTGTSGASAQVAGVAALVLSRNPGLAPGQVAAILTGNVTGFPGAGCGSQVGCGSGILNAGLAVAGTPDAGGRPAGTVDFGEVSGADKDAVVTSGPVVLSIPTGGLPVSVQGGEYSIGCDGGFTAQAGTAGDGDTICLRHAASAYPEHPAATLLAVGNHRAAFVSTTGPADTRPDALSDFMPQTGVNPEATVTSEIIRVQGIDAPAPVQVSGDAPGRNSRYSLNCDSASAGFIAEAGYIAPGGSICVQHVAPEERGTEATTTLTIGGESVAFTTTTRRSSGGGGALAPWFLAVLLAYAGLLRFRRIRMPPQASPARAP